MTASRKKVLAIVGPTAAGKSAVAEAFAGIVCAELISADSMQVYRGMDVATAKPGQEERERHRYHLIDVAEPGEPFTVVRYRELARQAVDEIASHGRLPVVVGGSGLYVRAVVDDLEFPAEVGGKRVDRERLEALPAEELYRRLAEIDPEAAKRIHRNNKRRLVRALEFIEETGRRFSEMQQGWSKRRSVYDLRVYGLLPPRKTLYEAINRRVDAMLAQGLVAEARRMKPRLQPTAAQALGYKELADYLSGRESLEQAAERLKTATRHFARRQLTWFGRDERVRWIDVDEKSASELAGEIAGDLTREGWLDESLMKRESDECRK